MAASSPWGSGAAPTNCLFVGLLTPSPRSNLLRTAHSVTGASGRGDVRGAGSRRRVFLAMKAGAVSFGADDWALRSGGDFLSKPRSFFRHGSSRNCQLYSFVLLILV